MMKALRQAISILAACATEDRVAQMQRVLIERTRYITICLEDIFQQQNASAILRSCDAFGVQDVHIVEQRNHFVLHRDIAMGSDKWLTFYKYGRQHEQPVLAAISHLRKGGYRLVATTPHKGGAPLDELDLKKGKVALMFGAEYTGLSDTAMSAADELITVPMYGFVESLNLSVCAAIVLRQLSQKLRQQGVAWQLGSEEQEELLLTWLKKSVRHSEQILQHKYGNKL
ncbi:MAG: RNA methyltransferase [Prevotellaceae bacterium]|jgi:tRNA (guanosine-2'-O-)-methyltransferase|nr:RNA methyltransferase [Prevotellaceae bacterium]